MHRRRVQQQARRGDILPPRRCFNAPREAAGVCRELDRRRVFFYLFVVIIAPYNVTDCCALTGENRGKLKESCMLAAVPGMLSKGACVCL